MKTNQQESSPDFSIVKSVLEEEDVLWTSQKLWSTDNAYYAELGSNGILKLFLALPQAPQLLWQNSTKANPTATYRLRMQSDGNLVIYLMNGDIENNAIWATGTDKEGGGGSLRLYNNGNFALYNGIHKPIKTFTKPFTPTSFYERKNEKQVLLPGQGQFLINISKGLAGELDAPFNVIGVGLIKTIFSSSNGPSTAQLDNDFANLIENILDKHDIRAIDSSTNECINTINCDYPSTNEENAQKEFLENQRDTLNSNLTTLEGIYNSINYNDLNPNNQVVPIIIPTYVKCVNIRNAVLQQLYEVTGSQDYMKSLDERLKNNKEFLSPIRDMLINWANNINKTHISKITKVKYVRIPNPIGLSVSSDYEYWDNYSGGGMQVSINNKHSKDEVKDIVTNDRNNRLNIVAFRKECDMQLPSVIQDNLESWSKLLSN